MDFPSLTGRKPRTRTGERRSTAIHSNVVYADLCSATASVSALPVSALQAAWAIVLATYTGIYDSVIFATALNALSSTVHNGESFSRDSHLIRTQACLTTSGSSGPLTNGNILKQLTESNEEAIEGCTDLEELSSHGTLVVLYNDEHSKHDEFAGNKLCRGKEVALIISAWPGTTGSLELRATYTDLVLDAPSALVVLAQLEDILVYILADATKPIITSSAAIRNSLLSISNPDTEKLPAPLTKASRLHAQFEVIAQENPSRVALDFRHGLRSEDATVWTYGELNKRADTFAKHLIHSSGNLSGKVIPVCMERRPELYIAILGILKAGAAWCPIDASFPARRRHDLIARTGSQVLVVANLDSADFGEGTPQGLLVIDMMYVDDGRVDQIELSEVQMGIFAYMIWTSGTTGDPKGVLITHEAAVTSMHALQNSISSDVTGGIVRCLQFSHFTFDVFVQDLFYTWGLGGTVISSTREIMLGSFAELSNSTRATHAHLTPAFAASVPRRTCKTLEVITMIGEKLPQVVADDWGYEMRAFNTYGPAETAVVSTFRRFGAAEDETQSDNIGLPLPSVSAYVMRNGLPIMKHGIGELALGGSQLSVGYWNDPPKTALKFVWNETCSRWLYLTGDIVRQLYDGSFEFVGREDDLIKIQGVRVELSEVSFNLRSCHPLVEHVETLFLDREDRPSKVIVAFLSAPKLGHDKNGLITVEKAAPLTQMALLEAQKNLPDYMVPRVILVVNGIPRTSSNKIDKIALQNMYRSSDLANWERGLATNDGKTAGTESWSPHESGIIAAVAEVSGTSRSSMSRRSDLRSIGIDSIAATRLAPILNSRGYPVSIADIFQCQSLDDIVEVVRKSRPKAQKYDIEAFHDRWRNRVSKEVKEREFFVAPTLPLQESLLSESMQDANAYWSNSFLSLNSDVDITRLQEAWSHVVDGTEALRTGFLPSALVVDDGETTDNTFLQLIYEKTSLHWTHLKMADDDLKAFAERQAYTVAEKHQKTTFRDPPVAITIFEQPAGRTMMISIHHSIRDEVSLDFILEDVSTSYGRHVLDHRHQFRRALCLTLPKKDQIEKDEHYWSMTLKGFATTDENNPWPDLVGSSGDQAQSSRTHVQTLTSSYEKLQATAIHLGASSVASILRVAWGCILLMYLETTGVVFAETCSDRTDDPTLTDTVGPLMTILPVPFRATASARETLSAQSRSQSLRRAHRSIHGKAVRRLLNVPEHQSVYPALFNFLPEPGEDKFCPFWARMNTIINLTVEHPLALTVRPTAKGSVQLELFAGPHTLNYTHLALLASQVDAFVEAMLTFPDIHLAQLSSRLPKNLLSISSVAFSEEVRSAYTQEPTAWVDYNAAAHPRWLAAQVYTSVEDSVSRSWTFSELQSAYKRVEAFIRNRGYFRRMIAVCLDRRLEACAVILGIMASGNIYLPVDEDLPEERKSFLIRDSQAVILFTITSLDSAFLNSEVERIYIDHSTYMKQIPSASSVETIMHPRPVDNAYLLYTSGSTGVPKGVLVGRGNLCSFIEGLSEYIRPLIPGMEEIPGKGKYLGLASRAFDVHLAEMFLAWRLGLAAVTAPRALLLDNLELALRTLKVTHASFVPSLIDHAGLDPAELPDLRYLGVGGEKMSKGVLDTWAASRNAVLVNAYGPTEMSIGCTATVVRPGSSLKNIGRPYGNSVAHVLVPGSNQHTLRGVAGELCFTGDLVANGYHNRPEAKGFVQDFKGKRMYRTGDIVRLMADDTLEYLRRGDDQTKVRGQRLEPGEISEAIRSLVAATPGSEKVSVTTIVAQHPAFGRPQLVSFVVAQRQANNNAGSPELLQTTKDFEMATDILKHCRKVLPAYMVPDLVLPLNKLPLASSSGKADLKELKVLFAGMPIRDIIYRSEKHSSSRRMLTEAEAVIRSAVTHSIAAISVEIFPDTDLFGLGLESLSAVNLAVKMRKLGYECTVSTILQNPSIQQLACVPRKEIDEVEKATSEIARLDGRFRRANPQNSKIRSIKPCLPLQETLVAASLNDPTRALYVNTVALRLDTHIDLARLCRAWTVLVADHEILRTCFLEFEDGFVQVIHDFENPQAVSWKEITTQDPESASHSVQSIAAADIIVEMGVKPPLRLTLFRPPSKIQSSILLFQVHHALYDGDSFAMILEELDKRYRSAAVSTPTAYDLLIEYVCSQDQIASEDFWRRYLNNHNPATALDRTYVVKPSTVGRTFAYTLAELEDFSASTSGTLASTMEAVFGVALAQTFGRHDVVFGAVLSGRTVPIENPHAIMAPCITTIPQRVNLGHEPSPILDIVKVAQQGFVESLAYQHTALRDIHRWIGADQPLFDCLVTYVQKRSRPTTHLWTELEGSVASDFPLSIEFKADHESNRMLAHCTFTRAFGDMGKAESLLEEIDLLLGALVQGEHITTEDLGISSADKSRVRLQTWDDSRWSTVESKMRDIAAELCGISTQDISKGSSFFSLGIDSITAIRFARWLRQSEIECSSADVMRHACIAALAEHIEGKENVDKSNSKQQSDDLENVMNEIPLLTSHDAVTQVYKCTPLQSSMLTQTLGSDGRLYANHHTIRLSSKTTVLQLRKAWESLVVRTEILRTTFHFSKSADSWIAAVHKESRRSWVERSSIGSLPDSLNEITECFSFRDVASFEQPPWRATVLKHADEAFLVVSMHHSLYDGSSIPLIFEDLAKLYNGTDLIPRPPFSDAARLISNCTKNAESFWLEKLQDFGGNGTLKAMIPQVSEIENTLKMDQQTIVQGCKRLGVTIQTVALLAYAKGLALICGQRDVVFGHVVVGRSLEIPGVDAIIGPFFNTVPVRVVLERTHVTNLSMVHEIQIFSGYSQAHQHASLSSVQKAWRQKVKNDSTHLFDSIFVFQNAVNTESPAKGLWTPVDIGYFVDPTEYPLNVELEQGRDHFKLKVNARMTREQLQDWLTTFEQIFRDIIEHPNRSTLAFPASLQRLPLNVKADANHSVSEDVLKPGSDAESIRNALSEVSLVPPEDIANDASIFSLGLDSISAIRVAAACRARGYSINVADVLQGLSLGGICRRLRGRTLEASNVNEERINTLLSHETRMKALALTNLTEQDVEEVLPCLGGQVYHLAKWLRSSRTMGEGVFAYRCSQDLDVDSLRLAWRQLRERHPVLRTVFVAVSSKSSVQLVTTPSALNDDSFEYVRTQESINDQIKQQIKQSFNLFSPPSILRLVRGDSRDYILIKLHHVTYDAWTIQKIMRDLALIYRKTPLPSPPSFRSLIEQTIPSLFSEEGRAYWRYSLAKGQQTLVKDSAAHSSTPSSKSIFITLTSAIANLHAVEASCRASSISFPIVVLVAFARALARHTSVEHPTFGLFQTGRSASFQGIEDLCSPCLNVTPVCVQDALTVSITESAQQLQTDLAERVPFEQSYMSDVLEYVDMGGIPLFNSYVNILSTFPPSMVSGGYAVDDRPLFAAYPPPEDIQTELFAQTASPLMAQGSAQTAVDALETGYLADENLYLDVVRRDNDDCVDFAVKCDMQLMSEPEVRHFVDEISREVEKFVTTYGK